MSSLEAFISGKCAVTSSGVLVPNSNPVERRRADENSLDTLSMASSTSRRRSRDPPTSADNNNTSNNSSSNSSNDTNIILAERTSNLINSYRDYVSGLDGYDIEELMISRDAPPSLSTSSTSLNSTTASPRRNMSNNQNLREYASRNESPPPLLRGWNHTNTSSNNSSTNQYSKYTSSAMSNRCDYEPYSDNINSNSNNNNSFYDEENNIFFDNDSEEKKYHYTHPIYHSKKFKRSVFASVLVAIVVIISWVSSSASSSSKEHQKDAQLEDALKHYEIMSPIATSSNNDNSTAALVTEEVSKPAATKAQDASSNEELEALTRHILCCSSSPSSSSSSSSSSISVETEYLLAESHHPVWYTRSDGWMGTTWQEAREFCSSKGSSSDNTDTIVELCPYEVYCPTGPHHIPYGGYRVETPSSSSVTNSRAPISDFPNGWVQVGSENACVQYSSVGVGGSSSSSSTTTHDEEDAVAMIEEVVHEEVVNTVNESVQNDNESQGVVTIVEDESKTDDVTSTTDSQVVTSTDATATNINQSFDMTSTLHRKFKPFWLSSNDGWNGGSYDDAVEFCSSIRGKQLCPYSVMCPHGPQQFVMGGYRRVEFEVEGEQYAPILGGENHWVMIGNMEHDGETAKCMTHRQLEGKAPEWGLNEERKEVKKYIMCCTIN
jgi:hypothetical protein